MRHASYNIRALTKARVITCSDGVTTGHRVDKSGPAVRDILNQNGFEVDAIIVVPDDIEAIATAIEAATGDGARLVITTGGTGIAPRDVTPEATVKVSDRIVPGFGELMRSASRPRSTSRRGARSDSFFP